MTLKDLEKRLKKEPDNLGLKVQVAGLMRESGRSTEAVELYRSVALAYRDQGRTQQSIAVCRAILEIAPDDERCIALLSTLQGRSTPSIPTINAPLAAPVRSSQQSISRPSSLSRPPLPATPPPPPAPSRPASPPTQPPPAAPSRPATPSTQPAKSPTLPPKSPTMPPRTSSQPPRLGPTVTIPPKAAGRALSEITPAAAPARAPTEPQPPHPVTARLPLEPPTRRSSTPPPMGGEPRRRSSMEETPLPKPVPHHIYDPTGRNRSIDPEELDTSPNASDGRPKRDTGLAIAARTISSKMKAPEPKAEEDISRPLDTRPVRRITSDELQKLAQPPPTVEHERPSDDSITQSGDEEELTTPHDRLDPEEA